MDSDEKLTASHYFRANSSTIFDELSKCEGEKQMSGAEAPPQLKAEEECVHSGPPSSEAPPPLKAKKESVHSGPPSSEAPPPLKAKEENIHSGPLSSAAKMSMYFPGGSAFSYIGSKADMPLIEAVSLGESILSCPPEVPSPIPLEVDRTHDAWIPCEATKEALAGLALAPDTFKVDKSQLIMPGIVLKEEFGDPVRNLVQNYLGEQAASERRSLTASSVTQDDRGMRQLMTAGCYHAAVNLTTQLLTVYGQGEGRTGQFSKHTAHSIQLWFSRIALLVKLRRFSLAEVECEPLRELDTPDLYFEFYPELYSGRKGSMVPFSFRLLVAELPQYLGKHMHALDRLSQLLATCNKIVSNLRSGLIEDGSEPYRKSAKNEAIRVWASRRAKVLYALARCAVGLKDFRLASTLLQRLLKEESAAASGLFAALGRLCLHLGDVHSAQEAFKRHLEYSPTGAIHDPVQGLLHSAFVASAQNDFEDATRILQQALKVDPENALVINNLSVSQVFVGRIREAIGTVEGAALARPDRLLHEALLLNLATMYELESSAAHHKKLHLLSLVAAHKGDGFNIAALKLQV